VPEHHVDILEDIAEMEVSGRRVQALHTPGHASHHIAYLDSENGAVFTGDVGGVRIRNIPFVAAPTPPPDIDLPAWRKRLTRLRGLRPKRLYLAHYGVVDDPTWHFDALDARLGHAPSFLPLTVGVVRNAVRNVAKSKA
jgi:glyoxylase-like metal-dependent hydrolase (beta-lactamase superfamily II)